MIFSTPLLASFTSDFAISIIPI